MAQVLAERFAVAGEAGLDDGGTEPEHPGLPGRLEDKLTVAPWWGSDTLDVEQVAPHRRATPIIESRVTSPASSSSLRSSVPAGLSGTTR